MPKEQMFFVAVNNGPGPCELEGPYSKEGVDEFVLELEAPEEAFIFSVVGTSYLPPARDTSTPDPGPFDYPETSPLHSERMEIRVTGPMGCGKTLLTRFLAKQIAGSPVGHFPVTIYDGEEREVTIDGDTIREFPQ